MSYPKKTITRNGQTVDCYGTYREDCNVWCVFADELLDGPWLENGCDGINSWSKVVEHLTAYAKREGTEVIELSMI